jgi:hypothetical protein
MKTKISLLLTALFASFALVSCDKLAKEVIEGEWPFVDETPAGEFAIAIESERNQGYVRAFKKINDQEVGVNRADEGDEIWLRASSYSGFEFLEWIPTNVTLSDTESYEIKFTMPANDVIIEAVFDDLSKPKATPYELINTTIPAHKALDENVKLRAWKAAQTRQVFGWFDAWSGRKDEGQNSMRGLPKEMSIIANWGQPKFGLSDWQKADMMYVKEVWGAKVVFTLFCENIGDDVPDNAAWATAKGSTSTDEATMRPAIAAYAKALYDACIAEGYDGFDWDFEPTVGGKTPAQAPLWRIAQQAGWFIEELSYWFGPQAKKYTADERQANGIDRGNAPTQDLLFLVDGEVHNDSFKSGVNNTKATAYVSYYVQQAYGANTVENVRSRTAGIISNVQAHIDDSTLPDFTLEEAVSRCILAENWENAEYAATGGGVFVMAEYKHEGFDTGGFGAYRIGLGFKSTTEPYKGSVEYANLRKAIDLQYGEGAREL